MFEKHKLNREIKKSKTRIIELEKKRYRSQGELVNAILCNEQPNPEDVEYFNRYTAEIGDIRDKIRRYEAELTELNK